MAEVILMPRLSDTMTEGVIAAWHKNVGDAVKKGDVLAEIETDKATMDLESYKDGVLLHIGAEKGKSLAVNDLLAIIGEQNENIETLIKESGKTVPKEKEAEHIIKNNDGKESKNNIVNNTEGAILMPRLSDTMTEGVIAAWHKNVGDTVKKGDVLAEIETDKATMDLESYKDGVLLHIGAKVGEKIPVNALLCIIDKEGTDINNIIAANKQNSKEQTQEEKEPSSTTTNSTEPEEEVQDDRIKISPLARKIASEKGIKLNNITGSGDGGRIVKKDIDSYTPNTSGQKTQETKKVSEVSIAQKESFEDVSISSMRKTIAKRLSESKFTAPHFYLTMSVHMDKIVESRTKLNEISDVKISFNDIVIKAVAIALKKHPAVNASWLGEVIRYNHHIHIGVAIAVEEGLLVPVVRFADTKSLSHIAWEVKEYAQKAKNKKLQPNDWQGNTFTISNLGMFGIDEFTAIINPPDACILAVGAVQQIPVVKDGNITIGNIMKLTLSCDHRVVDGATGAAFLQTVKKLLEEPLCMLV